MSKPTVMIDFQFIFLNGHQEFVTVLEGRDKADVSTQVLWTFTIHHEDGAEENVVVYPAHLACWKMATRTIQPESTIEDQGQTKIA